MSSLAISTMDNIFPISLLRSRWHNAKSNSLVKEIQVLVLPFTTMSLHKSLNFML